MSEDLLEIFSELYNKPIKKIPLRPGEKMLESLINETQSLRLIRDEVTEYMFIKPPYKDVISNCEVQDYNSKINPLTKFELKQYLHELNLIHLPNSQILNFKVDPILFKETKPFPYLKIENVLVTTKMAKATHPNILLETRKICLMNVTNYLPC